MDRATCYLVLVEGRERTTALPLGLEPFCARENVGPGVILRLAPAAVAPSERPSYDPGAPREGDAIGPRTFERGDLSSAIETLGILVGENERVGGSRAQHDLIEFTLLRACLRANLLSEARHLLGVRRPGASGVPVLGVAAVC